MLPSFTRVSLGELPMYENGKLGFKFVLPFVLGLLLFQITPFAISFALSFTEYDIISSPYYIGVENYEMMYHDPLFWKSMGITLLFVLLAVPARLVFALFIAHVLNFKLRGINFFRTAFYLPSVLGGSVAVAVLWRILFSQNGLVNSVLEFVGVGGILWLGSEQYSLWTIVFLHLWQFGSAMVVFLAALQSVPASLYEAALIDGANRFQAFLRITIPIITPVIFFNLIMQTINAFQEFNGPYLITNGGPLRSTYLFSMFIYDQSFRLMNFGYGSALSWVLFAIIAVVTGAVFWSSKYWVFYSGEKKS